MPKTVEILVNCDQHVGVEIGGASYLVVLIEVQIHRANEPDQLCHVKNAATQCLVLP